MTDNTENAFSIAYRDCKETLEHIKTREDFEKASTILFYNEEILEALKIASEIQSIGINDFEKWIAEHDKKVIDDFVEAYTRDDYDCDNNCIDDFVTCMNDDYDINNLEDKELDKFCCIKCFRDRYFRNAVKS